MGSTQKRIKKRREYLTKKAWAYTKLSVSAVFVLYFAFTAVLVLLSMLHFSHKMSFFFKCLALFDLVFMGIFIWWCARSVAHLVRQDIKQLPYVPPVTANTLPIEEVLVRGSEETAQELGKVLLRGTDSSAGTGEQELLRGSQGQSGL
ncbi:MAG TPA: hypothetical protein VFA07_17455 [Chthonomonadaceae bacterium]|nr:hypothetical protein [Chthonomonadaceae bacterium]